MAIHGTRLCACAAFFACGLVLQGCGGGGPSPSPSPSPAPGSLPPHCKSTNADGKCNACDEGYDITGSESKCLYACTSDLPLGPITFGKSKGLMLDDSTHHWCPDSIHSKWANTQDAVSSFRVAKAWEADWSQDLKTKAWNNIATYAKATGAKALVGTSLSCTEANDDADWKDVLALLRILGPDSVMGVAIGNEMELLWNQGKTDQACVKKLWQGKYVLDKFNSRVTDLDALGSAWKTIKVTSVFGSFIFAGQPFVNDPSKAAVLPLFQALVPKYKDRFVFSLNIYPYFDTDANRLDAGTKDQCEHAIKQSTCFDSLECLFIHMVKDMRTRMGDVGAGDNQLWVTETGWSSPKASTLKWDPTHHQKFEMANCTKFSQLSTMQLFYENFLKWDLSVPQSTGPDHVFFFGMRDSANFGVLEHFGLGGNGGGDDTKLCVDKTCKMQKAISSMTTKFIV